MLQKLLLENYSIYKAEIVFKTNPLFNKSEIFDQVRAIHNVTVLNPVSDEFLDTKTTDVQEFTLATVKFLVTPNMTALQELDRIKESALRGDKKINKIRGLLQFNIKEDTITKVY
jgi:hypothetical protein